MIFVLISNLNNGTVPVLRTSITLSSIIRLILPIAVMGIVLNLDDHYGSY